ncbi:MAG: hypothetical protein P8M30_12920 [Planctomycetaceae bacterium]|nr:hypothetical protein [Planctomycetaceae bacterium]
MSDPFFRVGNNEAVKTCVPAKKPESLFKRHLCFLSKTPLLWIVFVKLKFHNGIPFKQLATLRANAII